MNETYINIITGLSVGFLGSFHCIGMCGPIALSLPVHSYGRARKYSSIALYTIGRAVSYGVLGMILGFIGSQFRIWGLQQFISIAAGVLILLFILSNFSIAPKIRHLEKIKSNIQRNLGRLLQSPKNSGVFFLIGVFNGLLPCGLVYVAVAAALATTHIVQGALLMFSFGLGTLPVMSGIILFGNMIPFKTRLTLRRMVPLFVGMMAVMLILRGMNLGIPFLSPKMAKESTEARCHDPS